MSSAMLLSRVESSPAAAILAYCFSSMSMTLVNKYVVSGNEWNLNFFYLAVQGGVLKSNWFVPLGEKAIVGTVAILILKRLGLTANLRPYETKKAKAWFPISLLLVGMIYTSIQALQFLSVPVYTIFKNLTIIVIAYGEALGFGGSEAHGVTRLALLSFALMVLSSVVAAWADIQSVVVLANGDDVGTKSDVTIVMSTLHAGYFWMGLNIFCAAAYALSNRRIMVKADLKSIDGTVVPILARM
ncbi:UDP-galactose transporter [Apiospora rasikravindrae]|uniref:UDP-galactose transporter n=1 Tax=Apiospora rasikravindrae TaxID=990691 RepID=A0ABR1RPX2_9PEZI